MRALAALDDWVKSLPRTRRAVIALAVALFAVMFALRLIVDEPNEPATLVFAPSVALLAIELGVAGGLVGAAAASALYLVSAAAQNDELTVIAVASRLIPFTVIGVMIGVIAERLRESETRYRRIVETGHEGIWLVDGDFKTTYVNDRMCEMLGYTRDELLELPLSALLADDRVDVEGIRDQRRGGTGGEYDLRLRHRDGSDVWVLVSGRPLHDARGRFVGSLAMLADITSRRRAEEGLAAAAAELERQRLGRRQATELNDTVVQGLVLAKYALERGDDEEAARRVDESLRQAQGIVSGLPAGRDIGPGALRREEAALVDEGSR